MNKPKRGRPKISFHKQLEELLIAGKTTDQIKEIIPVVSNNHLSNARQRLGISSKIRGCPRGYHKPRIKQAIITAKSLRLKGLTLQAIGDQLGVTRERARQLISYAA